MRAIRAFTVVAALALTACESSTTLQDPVTGREVERPCIGVMTTPDPAIHYETSVKNIVLAVIFSETIVVPVVVIAKETSCPDYMIPSGVSPPTVRPTT